MNTKPEHPDMPFPEVDFPSGDARDVHVDDIMDAIQAFLALIERMPPGREMALARTKIEEAVMWATKAATK